MKIVILTEIERLCKERGSNDISIEDLRKIAVNDDESGLSKAYACGFSNLSNRMIEFLREIRDE